jgi:uncharacterized glyoxalase superfamily protein PhnB
MKNEFFTRPIFCVQDVSASIAYYEQCLGFTKRWEHGGETVIIAQVGRDGLDIILDASSVLPKPAGPSVLSMSLRDATKLDALYEELSERGAKIRTTPFQAVWQEDVRQFEVEDLDGNVLMFWGEKAQ